LSQLTEGHFHEVGYSEPGLLASTTLPPPSEGITVSSVGPLPGALAKAIAEPSGDQIGAEAEAWLSIRTGEPPVESITQIPLSSGPIRQQRRA